MVEIRLWSQLQDIEEKFSGSNWPSHSPAGTNGPLSSGWEGAGDAQGCCWDAGSLQPAFGWGADPVSANGHTERSGSCKLCGVSLRKRRYGPISI